MILFKLLKINQVKVSKIERDLKFYSGRQLFFCYCNARVLRLFAQFPDIADSKLKIFRCSKYTDFSRYSIKYEFDNGKSQLLNKGR